MFSNLMYQEAGLAPLSQAQISKLLNHHAVRVKSGKAHRVQLSPEQLKKLLKSAKVGKAHTLRFDPYQVANHQHLRGRGVGIHIAKALGDASVSGINAGSDYVDAEIEKQVPKDKTDTTGGKISALKKFNRWTHALGHTYQGIAHAVKPVAKPLMNAATQYAISQINPQNAQLFMNYAMEAAPYAAMAGVGVHKRRRGRPRKMHGSGEWHESSQQKAANKKASSAGSGAWHESPQQKTANRKASSTGGGHWQPNTEKNGKTSGRAPGWEAPGSGGSVGPAGYDVSGGKVRRRKSHKRKPALHFNL